MITREVKLAFIGGLDLIYIHKPYPLSHTGLHSHSLPTPPKKKIKKNKGPHPNTCHKEISQETPVEITPIDINVIVGGRFPNSLHRKVPFEGKLSNGKGNVCVLSSSNEIGLKTPI